ncbi:CHAT domain-containing protein [Okeania sp. SIO3I5]|uniref:CHAT domain-containing protein n=1 Tax=Okeania sp. SIO3I5 TaxID=2607805 RepID=UPI0025EEAB82|nr:CHAT domain-containing tetratricopeptide repeat protein [Okeania sp. SIO3I5]
MDEQPIEAYANLIQQLLTCPNEVVEILEDNRELVDEGLLQVMEIFAQQLAENDDQKAQNAANFLGHLKSQLVEVLEISESSPSTNYSSEDYLKFLMEVLEATAKSNGDSNVIYPLLQANLDKLDNNLAHILRNWATAKFSKAEENLAKFIANIIWYFSYYLKDFPLGNKANNMEIVIAGYEAVLKVFTRESNRENWAAIQNNLGIACWGRINGNRAQNLENAIAAYYLALEVHTKKDFPIDWAMTQNNLGNAYSNRIRDDQEQNLEKAIAAFNLALEVYTKRDFPYKWAWTQDNLGNAYCKRIRGNRAQNIEDAIAAFNLALSVYTKKDFPYEWGMTQYNLGNAYFHRIRDDRAQNLENAITAFNLALEVRTKKDFSYEWAKIQNNLGNAYFDRIRGDRAQSIEDAIAAYNLAFSVHTKKDFPYEWAITQNNLGNAYNDRISGDRAQNIENAIAAYNLALEVHTKKDFPFEWARTQHNLGAAYNDRISGDQAENLENAIAAYHLALSVYTKKDFPFEWAASQNNLGNAYSNRIRDDQEQNLENAIAAFNLALEVRTKKDFPFEWAETQNNLGGAYYQRIRGDRTQNLEKAIAAFNLALEVDAPKTNPINCLGTSRNLGNLHFTQDNWQLAIPAYEKAVTAVELIRSWSTDDDRRQEILENAIGVYQNIVQACVNANQIEKALEYVERSRSKRLVDLMASNDLYSLGEIPVEVKEWLEKHETIQQQIDQLWEQQQGDSHAERPELAAATRGRAAIKARNESIAELEAQKQEVYKKIRSLDRVLADGIQVTPLEFHNIQALIQQPTTAILSFYTIDDNTYLFVVRQNGVKVHIYSGLGIEKLQNWIARWLRSYLSSRQEWQQQMPGFLEDIGRKLKLEELCKSYLQDIEELILIPHLNLHFLPWSAMPVINSKCKIQNSQVRSDTSEVRSQKSEVRSDPSHTSHTSHTPHTFLGDYFRIRTLASCQVLDFCTQRPEVTAAEVDYGIVEDTHNDLPCSSYEAQHIAKMYGVPDNQRLRGEAATVGQYKLLLSQVKRLLSTHHAQSRVDNCMESALLLADGRITLGQLLSPAFRFPDLDEVFIDCCETNFGVVPISDDVLTLNTGFLCAGARGVISSLWAVDDLGTCLFSIFYHQLRKEGKNRSVALQLAQRQLRELTGKELKKRYKKELEEALGEKLEAAYKQLKEAKVRRDSYAQDSAEYQEWEKERVKLDVIYQRINYYKNQYLKAACKKEHPFEHPVYWSGFICAGLS